MSIADFAWLSRRLVIEVDGDSHETIEGKKRDAIKDDFLKERGFTLMRFDNHQVTDGPDCVTVEIETFLKAIWISFRPTNPQTGINPACLWQQAPYRWGLIKKAA